MAEGCGARRVRVVAGVGGERRRCRHAHVGDAHLRGSRPGGESGRDHWCYGRGGMSADELLSEVRQMLGVRKAALAPPFDAALEGWSGTGKLGGSAGFALRG